MRALILFLVSFSCCAQSTFHGLLSDQGTTFDLLRFSVKYRTTDYPSYLTTTAFSDWPTLNAANGVIRVETIAVDGAGFSNSVVNANFMYHTDVDSSTLYVIQGNSPRLKVYDLDWNLVDNTISFGQSTCYDPVNQRYHQFNNPGMDIYNSSGTLIESLTTPTLAAGNTMFYFDYSTGKYYVSPAGPGSDILIWERSGTVLSQTEDTGIFSIEAISINHTTNSMITLGSTLAEFVTQTPSGIKDVYVFPNNVKNAEGVAVMPDGTILWADPSAFHYSTVGGNRLWWSDPQKLYMKYDRSPSMTPFTKFSGGSVTGNFDAQKLSQVAGKKIYSPVYDTDGFTNTENVDAWDFEFSDGGDADITWVGSNTAPTVASDTNYFSQLPVYAGWGATIPSAESAIPDTYRYKQAVLTVRQKEPGDLITPEQIIANLGSKLKIFTYDGKLGRNFVYNNVFEKLLNLAEPNHNLTQATAGLRFNWSADSTWADDKDNNSNYQLPQISYIKTDTQGHIISVFKKRGTSNARLFSIANNSSNNGRMSFMSATTGVGLELTDNAGSNSFPLFFGTTTNSEFQRWDLSFDGSTYRLYRNNVLIDSDPGDKWLSYFTSADRIMWGITEGSTTQAGQHYQRLFMYCSEPLSPAENQLIQDFVEQEGIIAGF